MDVSNELIWTANGYAAADAASPTETTRAVVVASDVCLYCEGLRLVFAADEVGEDE